MKYITQKWCREISFMLWYTDSSKKSFTVTTFSDDSFLSIPISKCNLKLQSCVNYITISKVHRILYPKRRNCFYDMVSISKTEQHTHTYTHTIYNYASAINFIRAKFSTFNSWILYSQSEISYTIYAAAYSFASKLYFDIYTRNCIRKYKYICI